MVYSWSYGILAVPFCLADQDLSMLLKVYEQINGWRKDEGVSKIIRDRDLEKLAQSAGFVTSHSQHREQDKKAWGKKQYL